LGFHFLSFYFLPSKAPSIPVVFTMRSQNNNSSWFVRWMGGLHKNHPAARYGTTMAPSGLDLFGASKIPAILARSILTHCSALT
jgi:hypothetical protein